MTDNLPSFAAIAACLAAVLIAKDAFKTVRDRFGGFKFNWQGFEFEVKAKKDSRNE